jgi:peptide/nickel transport system permease protein
MKYFGRKLAQLVAILLAVTFLSFLMLNLLPGDTAVAVCGFGCDEEGIELVREDLGLNDNLLQRYGSWLWDAVVHQDLGESALTKQPVWEAIKQRMPVTLELLIYSQILALGIAIPAGIIAAQRPDGWFDKSSSIIAFILFAIPNFVLALVLVYWFAVYWQIFPATGYTQLTSDLPGSIYENLKDLFLPAVTLAAAEMAVYLRLLRTDMIATLQEDYITMAKAKGMPNRRILLRHAFRPSTFSLVTVAGLNMGRLIGGTLVIEVIFALNGLGSYLVQGIFRRDYIAVQGAVVVIAVGYVLINFLVDMLYAVLDPRVRHARALT